MSDLYADTEKMEASVSFYRENSRVKNNGLREVPKADYYKRMKEAHDVSKEDLIKVEDAINFENTAAARLALEDLEGKASEASKEDLGNEEFRRKMSSTVRLPTHGGSTEQTVIAEYSRPAHTKAGEEPKEAKVTFGRLKTTINTQQRTDRNFHTEADERMRKALGIAAKTPEMEDAD